MNDPIRIDDHLEIPAEHLAWDVMRASGPGGQHVNTSETAVRLRFDLASCDVLSGAVKARLRARGRVTDAGELIIEAQRFRSRLRNVEDARERLAAMVREALIPPKPRRPTRPTKASKKRRIEAKKRRGDTKRLRGRPKGEG